MIQIIREIFNSHHQKGTTPLSLFLPPIPNSKTERIIFCHSLLMSKCDYLLTKKGIDLYINQLPFDYFSMLEYFF
jgi:hypothetical protein